MLSPLQWSPALPQHTLTTPLATPRHPTDGTLFFTSPLPSLCRGGQLANLYNPGWYVVGDLNCKSLVQLGSKNTPGDIAGGDRPCRELDRRGWGAAQLHWRLHKAVPTGFDLAVKDDGLLGHRI
eukprot:1155464-Pelagomonas_calceolata.AAC.1